MSKKQWYGIIGLVVGLAVLVLLIVFISDRSDTKRDIAEEAGEEREEAMEDVKSDMSKKIGVDYEMMTYSEMSYYVEELEEEAREQGETLSADDIEEKIKEEYGLFNALAYSRDFIIGDEDDETTVNNVINDLLFVYYFSEGPSVEEDKQIKTLRTQNLYTYKNSLNDDSLKNEKEQIKVEDTFYPSDVLIADTQGFQEGNTFEVGYPIINKQSAFYNLLFQEEGKHLLYITFGLYLDESWNYGELIDEINKLEVTIGDYEAKPVGKIDLENYSNKRIEYIKTFKDGDLDEDAIKKYVELESEIELIRGASVGPMGVYRFDNDLDDPSTELNWEWDKEDVEGYEEHFNFMKKEKQLLEGTFVNVNFEIEKESVFGDLDLWEEDAHDYFLVDGNDTPIITIDGVDIKLDVTSTELIEDEGIYYQR